jgi:co-chaperonin GroES (HSP10)
MTIEMFGMNVALKEAKTEEKVTDGGIYVPTTVAKSNLRVGVVIAAGPGEMRFGSLVENPVKKGDKVIFDARAAQQMDIDGVFTIVPEVIGKVS